MREWIDFTRNNVTFRERREKNPPVDRCVFDWTTRIDGQAVMGVIEVSHILITHSKVDYRELVSYQALRQADHFVNDDKREIERRRNYEAWKRFGLDAFA